MRGSVASADRTRTRGGIAIPVHAPDPKLAAILRYDPNSDYEAKSSRRRVQAIADPVVHELT